MRSTPATFAVFLLVPSLLIFAHTSAPSKKPTYEATVEKIKAGDNSVDFRELRMAYVGSETRNRSKDTDPQKKAMNQALRDKDYEKTIKIAEEVLRENFVDMDAQYAEYVAYREQPEG